METKKIISAVALVAILAMCLVVLTGCGDSFDPKKLAGKYTLTEMSQGEEKFTEDTLKLLKDNGYTFTMELKEDGTGTMNMYNEKQDLKFDKDNITIDGDSAGYTFKDNKITVTSKDITMVFTKD